MGPREEGQDPDLYVEVQGAHECCPGCEHEVVQEAVRVYVLMDNSEWEDMPGE